MRIFMAVGLISNMLTFSAIFSFHNQKYNQKYYIKYFLLMISWPTFAFRTKVVHGLDTDAFLDSNSCESNSGLRQESRSQRNKRVCRKEKHFMWFCCMNQIWNGLWLCGNIGISQIFLCSMIFLNYFKVMCRSWQKNWCWNWKESFCFRN